MLLNSAKRYGAVAVTLHWLTAAAIIGMLVLGKYMTDLADIDQSKFPLYQLHKSIGITILVLSVGRLLWRLANVVPPLPAGIPAWQRWGAHGSHILLYVLIIAIPLSGWAQVSSNPIGIPTIWFGQFEIPPLPGLPVSVPFTHFMREAHENLGNLMILLLLVHVGAALKHHFWDRDTVLRRMLPFTNVE